MKIKRTAARVAVCAALAAFCACACAAESPRENAETEGDYILSEEYVPEAAEESDYERSEDLLVEDDRDYIYNPLDVNGDIVLNAPLLSSVVNADTALNAMRQQIVNMTAAQKLSAANVDLTTLYAETAVSQAAAKTVTGQDVIISRASVSELEDTAERTREGVERVLSEGGIDRVREIPNTVTFRTEERRAIRITIQPDILETGVDRVRVETPTYGVVLRVADLAADLTRPIVIETEDVGENFETGTSNRLTAVSMTMPREEEGFQLSAPVTLSFSTGSSDTTYLGLADSAGGALYSKYNPATARLEGKANASGVYSTARRELDFKDISQKSKAMQEAIKNLASRGVINGTSPTTFEPDKLLTRAQFVSLVMRGLGKIDGNASANFTDVKSGDWFRDAAASSQKYNIISGFPDGSFRGLSNINKGQMYTVVGRILVNEARYNTPYDPARYLTGFSDGLAIDEALKPMVALASRENLIVRRTDGRFAGGLNMTRGDAALILYNLFQKIW